MLGKKPIIRPKKIPFSTKAPRSMPVINTSGDLTSSLAKWNNQLRAPLKTSIPATTPRNFSITSARGGLQLTWSPVQDSSLGSPDGYQILKSMDGTFTDDLVVIPISGAKNAGYFDPLGGTAATAHYRLRTTSGTVGNPQSKWGAESGVISHTSIDSTDVNTKPSTKFDNWTTDKTAAHTRTGNYGFEAYQTSLGASGGSGVGSGASGSGGSGTGSGSGGGSGSVGFNQIASGDNQTASMLVSAGGLIGPDITDAGIIIATNLWNVAIDPASTPANNQTLTFNSTTGFGEWESPKWAALTGDLLETQVIPWDGGTVGTPDTGISRIGAATLAIGNGTAGDFSGTLKTTIVNAVTGYQVNGIALAGNVLRGNGTDFVSATLAAADLSNGTTGTGAVVLAGSPSLTGTASLVNASLSGTLADGSSSVGTSGQVLESTGTATQWTTLSSGTVTSFSAGNLSPIFTTSVATATTTPALTFALSTQSANTFLAGPTSGAAAAPAFRTLIAADLPNGLTNQNTTSQSVGSGGNTVYVTNSNIHVPASGVVIGTVFTWRMSFSKTAAGTAASSVIIYVGTNATTSDTAETTLSLGTGSAASDHAWADITVVVQGPLTGSCVAQWTMRINHNSAAGAGLSANNSIVGQGTFTFNSGTSGLNFGLGFTSGASVVVTIDSVFAQAFNLGG